MTSQADIEALDMRDVEQARVRYEMRGIFSSTQIGRRGGASGRGAGSADLERLFSA